MKKLLALFLLCLSMQTFAVELAGVKLDGKAQLGSTLLQLNGQQALWMRGIEKGHAG